MVFGAGLFGAGPFSGGIWQPQWQLLVAFNNNAEDAPTDIATVASPPGTLGGHNVWTDITADVRTNLDTNRGRQHEIDSVQAGTLTVTLDNRTGKYDPWSASSPYAGLVLPGKPCRLQATLAGAATYYLFTGRTDVWATQWTSPSYSTVALSCVDLFADLNNAPLVTTVYERNVAASFPDAWWQLGDPAGSHTAKDSSGNNKQGVYHGVTLGIPGPFVAEVGTAGQFGTVSPAATAGYAAIPNVLNQGGTADITVEAWVQHTAVPPGNSYVFSQQDGVAGGAALWVNTSGYPNFHGIYNVAAVTAAVNICDGLWHHLVGVCEFFSGRLTLYVDGGLTVATSTPGTGSTPGAQRAMIGGRADAYQANCWGNIAQVAVYNYAFAIFDVGSHYSFSFAPPAERSGQRIARIFSDWLQIVTGTVDDGDSTVQAVTQPVTSTTVLAYLQLLEQSEGGLLYMDVEGLLEFRSRSRVYTSTTSTVTFGDNAGGGEIPFELGPQIATDTQDTYGQVILQRDGGSPQLAPSTSPPFAARTYSKSGLLNTTDVEVLGFAYWLFNQFATPKPRIRQITIRAVVCATTGADPANLLGLEIGTVVTVNRHTVPGGGTSFSQVCNVEGINFHVYPDTGDWNVELQLTPLPPQRPWILGTSQLGVDTNLFF